jgi:hypothetical protein
MVRPDNNKSVNTTDGKYNKALKPTHRPRLNSVFLGDALLYNEHMPCNMNNRSIIDNKGALKAYQAGNMDVINRKVMPVR